jgi:glycosyltransferase involved in cell wall biosynthesis
MVTLPFPSPSRVSPSNRCLLYVVGSLDLGGSERHLAMIAPRLRQLGWRPVIYCLSHAGVQATHLREQGVEVVAPPAPCDKGRLPRKFVCLALSCLRLFWLMLARRPRIAHFFLPLSYLIGGPLAMLAGLPRRVMSRRSLNIYQDRYPLLRKAERLLHRRMQAVLGNSRAVVRDLAAEGCDSDRLGLIYNGIDAGEIEAAAPGRPDGAPLTLIIVANLIAYKGHADLLQALAAVSAALPAGWRLRCVGRDDGIGAGLAAQARRLGIDAHVDLLGERHDVAALLAFADIGILCSHEEGFSNAVLEGMAAGLPMVVTDVGGNGEAVLDGTTGFVVPSRDPQALGQAIVRLAADAGLRERMGAAARQRQQQHFSIEACVARYNSLYRALDKGERLPADLRPGPLS